MPRQRAPSEDGGRVSKAEARDGLQGCSGVGELYGGDDKRALVLLGKVAECSPGRGDDVSLSERSLMDFVFLGAD